MELFSIDTDKVIDALFITGRTKYSYVLENIVELIDKLDIQRRTQNEAFYKRLELDFQEGCVTPAITIAYINNFDLNANHTIESLNEYILENIKKAFVLDGIQRLNTLRRVYQKEGNKLDLDRYLYVNIIICPERDNLLYRMVTLNNGQKPMTARHQIEILADSVYDYSIYKNFNVFTEKESAPKNAKGFKKADIMNAYISFLSNSTNLDNKKIIEDKMDELVARKIIESKIITENISFERVLILINKLVLSDKIFDWLKNGNNLIGFTVGLRNAIEQIENSSIDEIELAFENFEKAFKNINVSKIKISRERRRLAAYFISKFNDLKNSDSDGLTLQLAEEL